MKFDVLIKTYFKNTNFYPSSVEEFWDDFTMNGLKWSRK